jgi:hypothetical protein
MSNVIPFPSERARPSIKVLEFLSAYFALKRRAENPQTSAARRRSILRALAAIDRDMARFREGPR